MKKILSLFLSLFAIFWMCFTHAQNPSNYNTVSLCNLDLNRTATKLSSTELATVSPAFKGFVWNNGDNETDKFRPQGITDITLGCRKFIAVSWYGRSSENYENRGARISFADISDMNNIKYRHVLLVDENYNTFNNIHAGGLFYKDDTLYIPDTRSGSNKRIYGFSMSDIKRVPSSDQSSFYNYGYIVKRVVTHHLPIQASTISYDWDSDEMLVATFDKLCTTGCTFNSATTFSWFKPNQVNGSSPYHQNFFDKAQGMASIDNPWNSNKKLIWMASSWGRNNPSHIYATNYDRSPNNTQGQTVNTGDLHYTAYQFPPGLENLHFEQDKSTLWTLTEFTPNEGTGNNRFVFAFNVNDLLPPGQNPDEYTVTDLCDLSLNRTATQLDSTVLASISSAAKKGFVWNNSDNSTLKYRPKGIAKTDLNCRDYVAVSWYGRSDENYENRGARVSFVDVSDEENIKYRHVLLVDEAYKTFENIHVGALMIKGDTLFLPDTRNSSNKRMYAFDLNDIKRVPNAGLENYYNYRYILKRVATIDLPINASTLSYDWDTEEMVGGTFKKQCDTSCTFNENSTVFWSSINNLSAGAPYHSSFFDKIQGMASMENPLIPDEKIIWTSTSFGRNNPSKLYASSYDINPNISPGQQIDTVEIDYNTFIYPPGLNDLYLEENKDTLWSLTEFGTNEGSNNNRYVFALGTDNILPPEPISVGVKENVPSEKVNIYPNPSNGSFTIEWDKVTTAKINIYNSIGERVKSLHIIQETTIQEISLSSGYYTVEIIDGSSILKKKLIIN